MSDARIRLALKAMVDYFETAEWRMVDAHEWQPLRDAARAELRALLAVARLVRKVVSRPLEPGEVADPEFKQAQRLIDRLDKVSK
jgi:hypothetical protein